MTADTRRLLALTILLTTFCAARAWALPNNVHGIGAEGDTTVLLTTWDQVIEGDQRSRCIVNVIILSDEVPFTQGDSVIIEIYEDDVLGDDLIWQEEFEVSSAELTAGQVDRTFDCTSDFGSDQFGEIEIYAEVSVNKDECGFFCSQSPVSSNISLTEVEDDDSEQDDSPAAAVEIEDGERVDLIAADEDWVEVSFSLGAVNLRYTVDTLSEFGALDVGLFDDRGQSVAEGRDTESGTVLSVDALPVGTYHIRVSPRVMGDFNFYDAQLLLDLAEGSCTPGDEDVLPCGSCGQTTRRCDNNGQWGDFDVCNSEGPCTPGDERTTVCGDCGTTPEICNDACDWDAAGECVGEGECERASSDRQECNGGFEFRTCDNRCQWGDFGPCVGDQCEDGEVQDCYTGPNGTEGVGVCHGGRQICEQGRFSPCVGEVVPFSERCNDGRDTDCDGLIDGDDPDCAEEGAEIGIACVFSSECADGLTCLINQFINGYCGKEGCGSDAECGDKGVCGRAFGQSLCLRTCESDANCRTGYLCADVGGSGPACIPRCSRDTDCTGPDEPFCDLQTGLCSAQDTGPEPEPTPEPGVDPGPAMNPEPNPTPEPSAALPAKKKGGCATHGGTPGGASLMLVLLLLVGLRRRS